MILRRIEKLALYFFLVVLLSGGIVYYALVKKEAGEVIIIDNPYEGKNTRIDINFVPEIDTMSVDKTTKETTGYRLYVKDEKVYALNLVTEEETMIFYDDVVSKIAVRVDGNTTYLLVLSEWGNVYLSMTDIMNDFSEDLRMKKLEVSEIESLFIINTLDKSNLYGITTSGEEILINE